MKKLWPLLVLVMLCVACGGVPTEPTQSSPTTTPTLTPTPKPTPTPWPTPYPTTAGVDSYVLVHHWYGADPSSCATTSKEDRTRHWHSQHYPHWQWSGDDDICTTVPGTDWLRMLPANAHPTIGPYDSRNPEVRRHQIRQMKAAGFKGAFIPTYTWSSDLTYMFDLFWGNEAKGIVGTLQIAKEEGFTVGLEFWGVPDRDDTVKAAWVSEIARHVKKIQEIESSPLRDAYVHIGGKPAIWLFDPSNPSWKEAFHKIWMTPSEAKEFFDGTADDPRSITWVLRCTSVDAGIEINASLKHATVQVPVWTDFPYEDGFHFNPTMADELATTKNFGMIPTIGVYTGFGERSSRYGLRKNPDGTSVIESILNQAKAAGAKIFFVESWNEWGEGSQLEPGINIDRWRNESQEPGLYIDQSGNLDSDLYLKIFQRFHGMQQWVQYPSPPCSIVDPLILRYYPNFQCVQ